MSTKQTPAEAEEVKDLEQVEEVQDLTEVPEEIKEASPTLKSGGLRGISTPTMIHKHLDNFLASIAGETPVDTNVRNSLEYWLKQIAGKESVVGALYRHDIRMINTTDATYQFSLAVSLVSNKSDAYSKGTLLTFLKDTGILLPIQGSFVIKGSPDVYMSPSGFLVRSGSAEVCVYGIDFSGTVHGASTNPIEVNSVIENATTSYTDVVTKL